MANVQLSWDAVILDDGGAPLTSAISTYEVAEKDGMGVFNVLDTTSGLSHTIVGAAAGPHTYGVRAVNATAPGAFSEVAVVVPSDVPAAPGNLQAVVV